MSRFSSREYLRIWTRDLITAADGLTSTLGQVPVWWHSSRQGQLLYFRPDIFTLGCLSSSSDWARLKWSAEIALFLLASLWRSPNIFLQPFEVCNITDAGSALGLLHLLYWFFSCMIRFIESCLSPLRLLPQKPFISLCLVNTQGLTDITTKMCQGCY